MRRSTVALVLIVGGANAFVHPATVAGALLVMSAAEAAATQAPDAISTPTNATPQPRPKIEVDYGRLPIPFEPNRGQTADAVRFLARGPGYTLFVTADELVMSLRRGAPGRDENLSRDTRERGVDPAEEALARRGPMAADAEQAPGAVLRIGFAGANPAAEVTGIEPLGGHSNYFIGNEPAEWRTGIPHYRRVRVDELYPGIDLVLYGNPQPLEYDFVLAPGADPEQIRLTIAGAGDLRIDGEGDLVLAVAGGEVVQKAPRVYQDIGSKRRLVSGGYRLLRDTADPRTHLNGEGGNWPLPTKHRYRSDSGWRPMMRADPWSSIPSWSTRPTLAEAQMNEVIA